LPSREEKIARQSFKSSAIITAGNLISRVFLLITSLVVARLLGPSNYGLYSLALALPLFMQVLPGFGTRTAINRYSAYHIARGDFSTAQRMTINSVLFLLLTSSGLTGLSIALARWMSAIFLNRPELTVFLEVSSILIFGQAVYNYLTPAFVGWGAPFQDAIWTVVQSVLKLVISIGLLLLGLGVFGALWGYVLASLLAGIFGLVALYFTMLRKIPGDKESPHFKWNFKDFVHDVREMNRFGTPVWLGTIILNISQQPVLTVILSYIAANATIGFYSAAGNITQSVPTITTALTPSFFAAFASLEGINSDLGTAFKYANKYVSYFMMPFIIFLFASSNLLISILYPHSYLHASYFLEFLTLAYLPYAFGYTVLTPFVNGTGNTKLNLMMDVIEAVFTLVPAFVLIFLLKLGINGLLISIMLSNVAPTVFGLYSAQKYLHAKVDYSALTKTFLVSIACYLCIYALSVLTLTHFPSILAFAIELLVFLGLYLTLMPLTRAVRTEDISRLKVSTRGLRGISPVMNLIWKYERFLIRHLKISQQAELQ
jgi:O-antigen/teichoic acid export membrane protein